MARTMAHRGPDDEGYFISGSIDLAFADCRSLIWPEATNDVGRGRKNLGCSTARFTLPELRVSSKLRVIASETRSDTEVIVHGYKQWAQMYLTA